MSTASQGRGAQSPGLIPLHHTPMSERQQLALIKRLELAATSSTGNSVNDSLLVSPPRAPLQVVNGPNPTTPLPSVTSSQQPRKFPDELLSNGRLLHLSPAVERLLKKITKRNSKGETPLHTAAIRGSARLVRQLLLMGADPNAQDHAEWSPLHEACNRGNRGVVRVLLEFGADLNLKGFAKDSPLHDAARNGHIKVVKFLIRSGADIFVRNAAGRTPREEAEVTLERVDSDDLVRTIAYLRDAETRRRSSQQTTSTRSSVYSDVSDDDDEDEDNGSGANSGPDDDDEEEEEAGGEAENEDVAKFLGLTKSSPDVQKAFRSLGLMSASKMKSSRFRDSSPSSVASNSAVTPTTDKRRRNSDSNISSKLRLTYDSEISTSVGNSDTSNNTFETRANLEFDPEGSLREIESRKRKTMTEENVKVNKRKKKKRRSTLDVSALSNNTSELHSALDDSALENLEEKTEGVCVENAADASARGCSDTNSILKVPPLKIFLSSGQQQQQVCIHGTGSGNTSSGDSDQAIITSTATTTLPPSDPVAHPAGENFVANDQRTMEVSSEKGKHGASGSISSQVSTTSSHPAARVSSPYPPPAAHLKKRKLVLMAAEAGEAGSSSQRSSPCPPASSSAEPAAANAKPPPLNDIEKFINLRKQVEQRRKNIFPVLPKPPEGYKDYLMNRKTYLLHENANDRLKIIPRFEPPPMLRGRLRDLFISQETERHKLRIQQLVEKEKLVLAVEQEILRVHGRAARALANQTLPYSVCNVLRDEEIYNPIDPSADVTSSSLLNEVRAEARDARSRFNGRIFLSWLQDVDDKWEKIKEQMILRHHNEAESLNAVQKMEWEWSTDSVEGSVDNHFVPIVHVSEDFCFDMDRG